MNEWREVGYRHHVLVSPSGECLAEVEGTYPSGTYMYGQRHFIDLESAMRAAEADHGGFAGREVER